MQPDLFIVPLQLCRQLVRLVARESSQPHLLTEILLPVNGFCTLQNPAHRLEGLPSQGRIQNHRWIEDMYGYPDLMIKAQVRIGLIGKQDVTGPESASKAILVIYGE